MSLYREVIDIFWTRVLLAIITFARRNPVVFLGVLSVVAIWPLLPVAILTSGIGLFGKSASGWFFAKKWRVFLVPILLTPFFPLVAGMLSLSLFLAMLRNP